jgi:hypothetical protein
MNAARAILLPHKFELTGAAIGVVAALAVAGGLVFRLLSFGIPADCLGRNPADTCIPFQPDINRYFDAAGTWGTAAIGVIVVLPALLGLLLGISLVGKELDQGTATFAWSIGPSRRRWLVRRVVPIGLAIVVVSLGAGALADWLEWLRAPGIDADGSYGHLGIRGPVVGAAGLAFFGIALLVGSIVGRVLPALLLAGALVIASFVGVTFATDAALRHETVLVYGMDGGVPGRSIEYLVQAPDGEVMSWEQAYLRYGSAFEDPNGLAADFRTVLTVNPPEIYPLVVARMALLYLALGLGSIVLAFAVVDRRRP